MMTTEELSAYNELSKQVIGAAINVHKELGPGLLESAYEYCLMKELELLGLKAESQVELPLFYKGLPTGKTFRIDMIVEDKIILELKSVESLHPVNEIQLLTYLKLTGKKMGLLINFNVPVLKDGIKRKINDKIEYKGIKRLRS